MVDLSCTVGTPKWICKHRIELIELVKRKKFKCFDSAQRLMLFLCFSLKYIKYLLCKYLFLLSGLVNYQYTIEEKVIERAYKKLALDALVIQQGRLAEQKSEQFCF